jgi:hypothetical protein
MHVIHSEPAKCDPGCELRIGIASWGDGTGTRFRSSSPGATRTARSCAAANSRSRRCRRRSLSRSERASSSYDVTSLPVVSAPEAVLREGLHLASGRSGVHRSARAAPSDASKSAEVYGLRARNGVHNGGHKPSRGFSEMPCFYGVFAAFCDGRWESLPHQSALKSFTFRCFLS